MVDRETITKIIEYGSYAPSGDNSQPWRFEIEGNKINVFNIPGKDNPILNVRNSGSYVAHGALIENMLIAASQMSFAADLKIFPQGISDLVSSITLSPSSAKSEPLFPFIKERATNRKPYKKIPLSEAEKEVLLSAGSAISGCELKLVEEREMIRTVAEAMSVTEKVALETRALHNLFFKSIFWDETKNKRGESGLYIKTLEVPPPVRVIFKMIKKWPVMRFFNAFGFNKLAAKGNAALYAQSAAHGAIIIEDESQNFVAAGRVFQRAWLEATRLGLFLQPVTGTLFLARRVEGREDNPFSEKNSDLIRKASQKISFIFGINGSRVAAMLFRIGRADSPSARSGRKTPEVIFK